MKLASAKSYWPIHYYRDWHCTEAIPIFRRAEQLLGTAAIWRPKAPTSTAQMYIEVGRSA
ncbi:MAG: hypothetical protein R2911_33125 [Caldilineaceae bacterium]